jgi:hypothetical protein
MYGRDGVAVFANVCPVHGPDGRDRPANPKAKAIGIEAFKARPLPGRGR